MSLSEQPALSRLEVLRGLRISTWEGIWATIWLTLTTGAFQIGFARYLGASDFTLGLLAGLPAAVNLLQIPAGLRVERGGSRKSLVAFPALAGRLCWLLILLVPFVLPSALRVPAFVVLLTLSSALLTITAPAWTSWMSDLVPPANRGRYFGQRNMLAGLVTMLAPLPAGWFLDQAVKYQRFSPSIGFAVLFGLACCAAVGACVLIRRQPEPPRQRHVGGSARVNPFKSLAAPLANPNFRRFLFYSGGVVISQTLSGQFFTAWQVGKDGLNLPYLTVQILGAVAAGAGLATTVAWGYLADKYGSRPVLMICTAGVIVAPFLWLLTIPSPAAFWQNVAVIIVINLCSGAFWAGVGLTQFNLMLSSAEPSAQATYVAVFAAFTGILGGIAPVLGGILMTLLQPVAIPVGPLVLNNYKILFLITGFIRISCLFLLNGVKEADGRSTRYVLNQLTSARPVTSFLQLRRLARPTGALEREQAVEQLGELRSPLAVEELVAALDDVSPAVREGAARALGGIRDARAVPALAAKLFDPAAAIGELAAEALGAIGSPLATSALARAANGEDATVRVAALRALARIGDPDALPALIAALSPQHPTACEAACGAVGALASQLSAEQARGVAEEHLLPLLASKGGSPRGIRFAAARGLRAFAANAPFTVVDAAALLPRLEATLATEPDPAVAAQAAIAFVGLGRAAGRAGEVLAVPVLAILDRPDMQGLAYKQTLEAVADAGLPEGAFYPYLGLDEMARDETATRLAGEIRRLIRRVIVTTGAAGPDSPAAEPDPVMRALEAYTRGEIAAGVQRLAALSALHPQSHGNRNPAAASTLGALARRLSGEGGQDGRPEEFLLALALLKEALD